MSLTFEFVFYDKLTSKAKETCVEANPRDLLNTQERHIFEKHKDVFEVASWCAEVSLQGLQPYFEGQSGVVVCVSIRGLPASEPECNGQAG